MKRHILLILAAILMATMVVTQLQAQTSIGYLLFPVGQDSTGDGYFSSLQVLSAGSASAVMTFFNGNGFPVGLTLTDCSNPSPRTVFSETMSAPTSGEACAADVSLIGNPQWVWAKVIVSGAQTLNAVAEVSRGGEITSMSSVPLLTPAQSFQTYWKQDLSLGESLGIAILNPPTNATVAVLITVFSRTGGQLTQLSTPILLSAGQLISIDTASAFPSLDGEGYMVVAASNRVPIVVTSLMLVNGGGAVFAPPAIISH